MSGVAGRLSRAVLIAGAAVLLLWPALVAGRPAVFSDTDGYYWLGESLAEAGLQSLRRLFGDDRPIVASTSIFAPDALEHLSWLGARSPAYGVFLFLTQRLGTLWLTVYLQALAAAWLIHALLRAAVPTASARAYALLIVGLSAFTSLPFFVAFAMPDLFAGLTALALALLLAFSERLSRPVYAVAWGLLALSLSFHRTHLLAAGLVLLAAGLVVLARRRDVRAGLRRCIGPAAAVAAAAFTLSIYPAVVRALPGPAEVGDPPFLAARVLADGPGRIYLREACRRGVPYALCAFQDAEMKDAEEILWASEPGLAVVARADPATRARLKAEEPAFVLGALWRAPGAALVAAARNFGLQLARFHVVEPLESPGSLLQEGRQAIAHILPGAEACRAAPGSCRSPVPAWSTRLLHTVAAVCALAFLAAAASRSSRSATAADGHSRRIAAGAAVLGLVLANAALCGALSAPLPRYEARVIWLVPALAGLFAVALARRPRPAARFAPRRTVEPAPSPTRI